MIHVAIEVLIVLNATFGLIDTTFIIICVESHNFLKKFEVILIDLIPLFRSEEHQNEL